MWNSMSWIAKGVVVVLAIMSVWSLTIAIERVVRFARAKKESLKVAMGVTPLLKQHKLEEAINFAKDKKFRHSHLSRVLTAGLTEFQYEATQQLPEDFDLVESSKRAIERETLEREASDKPVLAVVVSADGTPECLLEADSPVATFAYPESAARALGFAAARAEWLRRPAGTVPTLDGVDAAAARRLFETALSTSDDVWLDPAATRRLNDAVERGRPHTLAIGPEGGWTAEELARFVRAGATAVSLGPRILRARLAAVVATAILVHQS